jgi:hypothetical protein
MTGTPSKDRAEEARDLGLDLMLCTEAEEAILKASHALDKAFAEGMKRAAEIAAKRFDLRDDTCARIAGARIADAITKAAGAE